MAQRKAWTAQEDKVLRELFQQRKINKWSEIGRIMEAEFKIKGRSGKQCRQRYHNHLDNTITREKWTLEEEKELVALHNSLGNRWAEISRAISGRSENCVKNKYYSILRKGLRCINLVIKNKLKRYKELQISIIYKIVEACQKKFKRKSLTKEIVDNMELKKEITYYGLYQGGGTEEQLNKIRNLIEKIKQFSKNQHSKKQPSDQKKDDISIHSEQIQSSEIRDDVNDLKPRKTSIQNFTLEGNEPEEEGSQTKIPLPILNLLKVNNSTSIKQSSKIFENLQPRPYDLMPINSTVKSFQMPQIDHSRSPRPIYYLDSPYFDQLRVTGSFNSWSQFYQQ